MSFLQNMLKAMALSLIHARLAAPTADKQKIVDAANANLGPDEQVSVVQMDAVDHALIDYVEGRIEGTVAHK